MNLPCVKPTWFQWNGKGCFTSTRADRQTDRQTRDHEFVTFLLWLVQLFGWPKEAFATEPLYWHVDFAEEITQITFSVTGKGRQDFCIPNDDLAFEMF